MRHFPHRKKRKWDIEESQAMPRIRSLIIQRKSPFAGRVDNAYGYLNQAGLMFHRDFAGNPVGNLPSIMSKKPYQNRYGNNKKYIKHGDVGNNVPAAKPPSPSRRSKKACKKPHIYTNTTDIWEETTSQVKSERMTHEADSNIEENSEEKKNQEDLAWDERDWDEKDPLYALDDEDDEDVVSQRGKKVSEKKMKNNAPPAHEDNSLVGKVILILIAGYIRPEDIANFSCVCKVALMITGSAYFWKNLYFRYYRYYNSSTALPSYLQRPELIELTGFRTFVIRALYYLYEPYRHALNTTCPVGEGLSSPEAIKDFTCLYAWHHGKFGHPFTHFIKLRLCSKEGACYNAKIFANDNRGECILRVYCKYFHDVPLAKIMGLQLARSSVSVSANMRHHRVKLEFGRKGRRGLYVKSSIVPVFLDHVLKVDVLHWWHPQFIETLQMSIAENAANTK